jgi:hypothetical protein
MILSIQGSAPNPGSVARGGPNAPLRSIPPQRAGKRASGTPVRGRAVRAARYAATRTKFGCEPHDGLSSLLRLEKRRRAAWRLEPLVILEDRGQLLTEPDAARLVVEAPVPVQLQIVREIEGRQRGGHL